MGCALPRASPSRVAPEPGARGSGDGDADVALLACTEDQHASVQRIIADGELAIYPHLVERCTAAVNQAPCGSTRVCKTGKDEKVDNRDSLLKPRCVNRAGRYRWRVNEIVEGRTVTSGAPEQG